MSTPATGVRADSLVLHATYFDHNLPSDADVLGTTESAEVRSHERRVGLTQTSLALTGLAQYLDRAYRLTDGGVDIGVAEQTPAYERLKMRGAFSSLGVEAPYNVVSIEMRSPLAVVIEVPVEVSVAMLFGILYLAERVYRSKTVVSKNKAKDLRDKAVYDRQRELIMQGKADAFAFDLSGYPVPNRLVVHGSDESPSDACLDTPQLPRPSDE
jgi:hypothetical protein